MQSTNSEKLTEKDWWWPSPGAFDDLEVTDIETGWQLSAPDDTELAEWLNYWNQSEEHHELFQTVFLKTLTDHAELVIENYGKNEDQPDGQNDYRVTTQDDLSGVQPEHQPGSDS